MGKKNYDRLSNLPFNGLEHILSSLPIKDAVKTSVLSSNWKYKYVFLRNLMFDDQCVMSKFVSVNSSSYDRYSSLMIRPCSYNPLIPWRSLLDNKQYSTPWNPNHAAIVKIVDRVLSSHIGLIHKFRISHPNLEATSYIDRWILRLSENSIRELSIEILTLRLYTIPSCLFMCEDIVHLELYRCSLLKLPHNFKGFESLKSLDIQRVSLTRRVFEKLIKRCPRLERLTLANCDGFSDFKINAPNLRFFNLEGEFEDFILENTSNLIDVSINLEFKANQEQILDSNSSNLLKFFAGLPNIRKLKIQNQALKYLAVGPLPENLPEPSMYLQFVSVCISFSVLNEIVTLLGLLRSSPALKELDVLVCKEDNTGVGEMYAELCDNRSCQFSQLQLVNITGISNKAEIDFIKFLLSSSPVLRTMTITPASVNVFLELVEELSSRCASKGVNIVYLEP